jgi:hypothetical protein
MQRGVLLAAVLQLLPGCARSEADAPPATPEAPPAAPASKPPNAPETTLRVTTAPIEALRSPFFSALEVTFQNPSSQWHQVKKVSVGPERQLFGPPLESLVGERLRAWQLAAREAQAGKEGPRHPALETLAPEAPPAPAPPPGPAGSPPAPPGPASAPAAEANPPNYLLSYPFTIAPGLFTRKWIVLYSAGANALLGQDLVLSYELDNGKTERVLVQYPKPAPPKD